MKGCLLAPAFIASSAVGFAAAAVFNGLEADSTEYCPIGYYLGTSNGVVEHDSYTSHADLETCLQCPIGETSAGGLTHVCHGTSNTWNACTHLACKVETMQHCNFHQSQNPSVDIVTGIATTGCTGRHVSTERVSVFHHGMENAGIVHKCKITGSRADHTRSCECDCMDMGGTWTVPTESPT